MSESSNRVSEAERQRLGHLARLAASELVLLRQTDGRLFALPLSAAELAARCREPEFSERVDAFVARFGRLQDLLGDKWLPAWLRAMQEAPATVLENLDRAEKLGILRSADEWLAVRKLRNLLVHEYLERPEDLHQALQTAHGAVPMLAEVAQRLGERVQALLS